MSAFVAGASIVSERFGGLTRVSRLGLALLLIAWLTGCAAPPPAPVEDRGRSTPSSEPERASRPPPPVYEVQRGDTLYSIAFRYGLDWREVARWNGIESPYTIRPGRELRLSAPPVAVSRRQPAPDPPAPDAPAPDAPDPEPEPASPAETERAAEPSPAPAAPGTRTVGGIDWRWPTAGEVARPFDPAATRRGIGISGEAGQDVVAAASGEVVYSGTALIGYGELVIVKHSATLLSAYAHNQQRLVEEGEQVAAGQPIARMGRDERDSEILHFEIRRDGQPRNPLDYLPARN